MSVHLPVLPAKSSLHADGTREKIVPADVTGRFARARTVAFGVLLLVGLALPWFEVGGYPAVWLDIAGRRFFLFGATFNAQDTWLLLFLLLTVAVALVGTTAVLGRAWCGWTCPQTVLLEGVYRRIERWTEGNREAHLRRDKHGFSVERVARKVAKHTLFVLVSVFLGHLIATYFVTPKGLLLMVREGPAKSPLAFWWVTGITIALYLDMCWFREQLCLIVCPYGRLQSVLLDPASLIVGYDAKRGEPRGKAHSAGVGDCVDCNRCVAVCPTGIDIRNGLQLDCIACTQCIDACDEIMDRLHRPRGLIRYDSQEGLSGRASRMLRPRVFVYAFLFCLALAATFIAIRKHPSFEANVLRLRGAPFVVEGGTVQNGFEVHLVNKRPGPEKYHLEVEPLAGVDCVIPMHDVTLDGMAGTRLPVFLTTSATSFVRQFAVRLKITREGDPAPPRTVEMTFLGPGR